MLFKAFQSSRLRLTFHRRGISTTKYDPSNTRNMALVAHIDSGKTTLTESILLSSSYISSPGSVDSGSTTTDFLPAERERGITIQSASIPVRWKQWTFNLIDTPGHADFGMEVDSASRVIDGAVVLIDSVEGVEAQTKGVWAQLDKYQVATRMIFLNKLDRPGSSFRASLLSLLSHRLHPKPIVLLLPIASFDPGDYHRAEPGIRGLVDLVKWEVWKWHEDGDCLRFPLPTDAAELAQVPIFPPSHPLLPQLIPARTALLDTLSMFSEDLLETLVNQDPGPSSYLKIDSSALLPHLRAASLRFEVLPVLCGSAMKHIGTELLMDYVGHLFPSPSDVIHDAKAEAMPVRALAWKVSWDKQRGWMTFIRVYSGTVSKQTVLLNANQRERERVSKLLLLYASEAREVDTLPFGSVGVILGLKRTRTGDTLVSTHRSAADSSALPNIIPPPPVMSASIIPLHHSDLDPVQAALQALTRTDPSVRVDTQDGQILVHGLGSLHLEIVEGRLRDEWGARFEVGRRRVSYREGLASSEVFSETHTQDLAGTPVSVTLQLELRRLLEDESGDPNWDGNVLVDAQGKPILPTDAHELADPMGYIAQGLSHALSCSPHTSLPMSHVHVRVLKLSYSTPNPPLSILIGASATILHGAFRKLDMGPLMEPYINVKVSVPEDSLGKVTKDMTESGGEILSLVSDMSSSADGVVGAFSDEGIYVPPDWVSPSALASVNGFSPRTKQIINALAPLSRMLDYSNRLRALSGGHGAFETENAGFREVSEARKLEILREIGKA